MERNKNSVTKLRKPRPSSTWVNDIFMFHIICANLGKIRWKNGKYLQRCKRISYQRTLYLENGIIEATVTQNQKQMPTVVLQNSCSETFCKIHTIITAMESSITLSWVMLKNGLTYFKNLATAGVSLWILQKFSEKCVIEHLRVIVQVFSCEFYTS